MRITILGLGPGAFEELTLRALRAIQEAGHIILRTERHPCVDEVRAHLAADCTVESCDDLYEQEAAFADVYAAIVARVLAAGEGGDVVYAVPGHPWVGEATTPLIVAGAGERGD